MKYILCVGQVFLLVVSGGSYGSAQSTNRTIEIHAKRFSFQPAEITVRKGETVTLALTSEDVTHGLLIEGLHINSTIEKGRIMKVSFTPDTAGDIRGKCGHFCGRGHGSMVFVVHVLEK